MLPVSRPPRTAAASRRPSGWNAMGARAYVAALGTVALVCATALVTDVAFDVETLAAIATALIAVIAVANLARLGAQIVAPSTLFLAALAVFHIGMIAPVAFHPDWRRDAAVARGGRLTGSIAGAAPWTLRS